MILCGTYIGKNLIDQYKENFVVNLLVSMLTAAFFYTAVSYSGAGRSYRNLYKVPDRACLYNDRVGTASDMAANIGLRAVFKMAKDVKYRNILGLNALTIRI